MRNPPIGVIFAVLVGLSSIPTTARSHNEVVFWNNVVLDAIRATSTPPPRASRALAMVQTAVYDAVNSIDGSHKSYNLRVNTSPTASKEAAAAQAAHDVLKSLFPALQGTFDTHLTNRLALIADGVDKSTGVSVGQTTAANIVLLRSADNSSLIVPYSSGDDPGDWRPTPPANAPALLPNWPQVTPFSGNSLAAFTGLGGPPALDSSAYADALNEVKDIGSVTSVTRTADQTNIALFWADGGGTATPPGHWNLIAQQVASAQNLSIVDSARLFAQLNIAEADAAIVAWTYKYTYDLWRPITAIRLANSDGNPLTDMDATWSPLIITPPFSTFTSGHSTFSGAASVILAGWFGDNTPFTTESEAFGVPDRSFLSFSAAADEAGRSRIYGGIHFEFDNQIGLDSGRALGQHVLDTQLSVVPEASGAWMVLAAGVTFAASAIANRRRRKTAAAS